MRAVLSDEAISFNQSNSTNEDRDFSQGCLQLLQLVSLTSTVFTVMSSRPTIIQSFACSMAYEETDFAYACAWDRYFRGFESYGVHRVRSHFDAEKVNVSDFLRWDFEPRALARTQG